MDDKLVYLPEIDMLQSVQVCVRACGRRDWRAGGRCAAQSRGHVIRLVDPRSLQPAHTIDIKSGACWSVAARCQPR